MRAELARPAACISVSRTTAGPRDLNEDRLLVDPKRGIFAVIDGSGGPGRGDRAAAMVVECLRADADPTRALSTANERIQALVKAEPEAKGMGATVALVRVEGNRADIYHVGEVRIYRVRRGVLEQLTEDHTLAAQLVKLKQLSAETAATHPARKSLLRYVGKEAALKLEHRSIDLKPGDTLVVCSDGVYAALPSETLTAVGARELAAELAAEVIEQAIAAGSSDNLSLVLVRMPAGAPGGLTLASVLDADDAEHALATALEGVLAPLVQALGATRALLVANDAEGQHTLAGLGTDPKGLLDSEATVVPLALDEQGRAALTLYLDRGLEVTEAVLAPLATQDRWIVELHRVVALKMQGRRQAERFAILNELGRTVASSLELDAVLHNLLDRTLDLTRADTAYIILPESSGLSCRYGLNRERERLQGLEISYTLANRVLDSREALCILDTGSDASAQTASVMALNLQSVMCVPMIVKDAMVGLLYVSSNFVTHAFTAQDLDLLNAIAGQTALSVQNAKYVSEMEQKQKLEAELSIAHDIQMGLLPTDLPAIAGYSLAARCRPAQEVGGDLFEVLEGDRPGFFIGDVSGKNVSAALYMAVTHMGVRALLGGLSRPADGLKRLNAVVEPDFKDCNYVTAFFATLEPETGRLSYGCAGHLPSYVVGADGAVRHLWGRGMFLGMPPAVFNARLEQGEECLQPGESLIMFTDGLVEARNASGEEFGDHRLLGVLGRSRHASAEELLETVYAAVDAFVGDSAPYDDLTVLVLQRQP